MVPGAAHPALLALLALLGAVLPGPGGAKTSVQPLNAIILQGGSVKVNCSTSCDQPTKLGIETDLTKKEVGHGKNWKSFELSDVQKDSIPMCYSFCDGSQLAAQMNITVYFLPTADPHLDAPRVLEVGTRWLVNCTLDGLFPASEAEVYLALGDHRPNLTVTYSDDSVLAQAWVMGNVEDEGTHNLKCEVNLGDQSRRSLEDVTVYSFPAPSLTLSEPEVSEGTTVNVECKAQAGAVVTLDGAPAGPSGPRAQLQLNVSAEYNGHSFFCSARLDVAGQVLHKNQTRELRVLYGPRLNERDCLGNWTWQEGSQQTLRCEPWGNPLPELKCNRKKDRASLPIGDLRPVKREMEGTYQCRATSPRGEVTREVVINVIYHQDNLAIIIPVATVFILATVSTAAYIYNYQRKIQKYELQKAQKAQEEAAMKLNTPATPP
ncbi:intercellular adhesion molecule 1 isoform X2 [Hippopotamus amphibius kiboko]|uniref:intercellular adhesion molecule 1 isoform X2 n=1 Tax=Hippopotamus amphibius kiboko TaxID=575201 RepID=UPI002596720B|nr:intercellular adhesion molecule 1 isoform X2 [Hippopotamus amphibius kiboko]